MMYAPGVPRLILQKLNYSEHAQRSEVKSSSGQYTKRIEEVKHQNKEKIHKNYMRQSQDMVHIRAQAYYAVKDDTKNAIPSLLS